jgi:hypothetical protein
VPHGRSSIYRLHQNRRRFHAALDEVKGEIEREFEAVAGCAAAPSSSRLASTDTLIDKIVYQLYGLTDAEIEIIERPTVRAGAGRRQAGRCVGDKGAQPTTHARVDALADEDAGGRAAACRNASQSVRRRGGPGRRACPAWNG